MFCSYNSLRLSPPTGRCTGMTNRLKSCSACDGGGKVNLDGMLLCAGAFRRVHVPSTQSALQEHHDGGERTRFFRIAASCIFWYGGIWKTVADVHLVVHCCYIENIYTIFLACLKEGRRGS